jgi:3-methyladenine DNA glycosylase/8-oxoguanine DNA glycosylase
VNPKTASWALTQPLDLIGNTGQARVGRGDPTGFFRSGRVWRAAYYESGPATLSMWIDGDALRAEAWGPGADESLAAVPALSGLADDPTPFDASPHPLVYDMARQHPGHRMVRTEMIFNAAVAVVIGQKVTGFQALKSYQALVRRAGVRAPLDRIDRRPLLLPPTPEAVLTALAGHGATALGIDVTRAMTLREVALVAHHLAEWSRLPAADAPAVRAALQGIPGVGEWTANQVTATALGDYDAVAVGDYHLKNIVTFALTGAPRGTDEEMVELLEPFRPHRARAVRAIYASGLRPPKYGPRMEIPAHVPGPFATSRGASRDAAGPYRPSRSRRRTR